jgi:hypothetical protein
MLFATLSATQASRIDEAIAALPAEGAHMVRQFLVSMVEPTDRTVLERLNLTVNL